MIKSFPWTCSPIGDGGNYSVEIVETTTRILGNLSPTDSGVVYWTDSTPFPGFTHGSDGLLAPTYLGANLVEIDTGIGLVQGWVFIQDLSATTDVSGGNANATDIIGLRRDVAAQTVRIFHGRGGIGTTYPLVQTSAIWEIPLVEILLDGSGNYSSFTDVRKAVSTPSRVLLEKIDLAGVDSFSLQLPPLFNKIEIEMILLMDGDFTNSGYWLLAQETSLPTAIYLSSPTYNGPLSGGFPNWWGINDKRLPDANAATIVATSRIFLTFQDYAKEASYIVPQFRTEETTVSDIGINALTAQWGYIQQSSRAIINLDFAMWDLLRTSFVTNGETFRNPSEVRVYGLI